METGQLTAVIYTWAPALGNVLKDGVELVNEKMGLRFLRRELELDHVVNQRYSVALLCAEIDPDRCHRSYIATKMQELIPDLEVVHL